MKKILFVFLLLALLAVFVSACADAPKYNVGDVVTLTSDKALLSQATGQAGINTDVICTPLAGGQNFVVDKVLPDGYTFWYKLSLQTKNPGQDCQDGWIGEFNIPNQSQ